MSKNSQPQASGNATICVALAQIAPVWLNREATLEKVHDYMRKAANEQARLVVFGEALVPGYPFWPGLTDGAVFESPQQKELFALYARQAVDIVGGGLNPTCALAAELGIAVYLGTIERATDRSGHSLYASLVYITSGGEIASVHRKLCPTYEERLVWSPGDGHGLRVHELDGFKVGGLNCWENWMPLARSSLYAQGENIHVAAWPGSEQNTWDITRFMAREGRSYVLSVSGMLHVDMISDDVPLASGMRANAEGWLANGASCIAGPDGKWVVKPVTDKETLLTATLDLNEIYRERQNFDPAGHYARPDVTHLEVDRRRQTTTHFIDT